MRTRDGAQWYLAPAARTTTFAIIAAAGSVIARGWPGILLSLASIALAIAGTIQLGLVRRRRAAAQGE